MRTLNEVTGIRGLMARSALPPGQPTQGGQWHNSTASGYAGWQWEVRAVMSYVHLLFQAGMVIMSC